ncbi:hypothetical protein AX16_002366 [Volvariella volvacea WC 439]|nr:hypothetical protein AX16_002366 [Volvariella volvacea WC 439]
MSHSSKSKAKGISASSFFDLKAELAKKEEELAKAKAAGQSTYIVGGVKRPEKPKTIWARENKGVKGRAQRDIELEEISKPTLESARAVLERKAKIYEKLRKGKTGGLSEKQYDALLVDFDSTVPTYFQSHSDDEDESLTVPKAPERDDDPIVEYEDEFGRIRTAPRSEVPREYLSKENQEPDEDEDIIIRNPVDHFPVYEPSTERLAEIAQEFSEENNPLNVHYDASREVRNKGAGFYQFSADEETRKAQMEELKAAREETEKARKEAGAIDIKPGEIEGMRDGESVNGDGDRLTTSAPKSRAMEKRKRELEERRKLLDAKRKKPKTETTDAAGGETLQPAATTSTSSNSVPHQTLRVDEKAGVGDPLAALEEAQTNNSESKLDQADDPFAALEVKGSTSKSKGKDKFKSKSKPASDADVFLAQWEQEFFSSKRSKS